MKLKLRRPALAPVMVAALIVIGIYIPKVLTGDFDSIILTLWILAALTLCFETEEN